jgi:hypothetical protein
MKKIIVFILAVLVIGGIYLLFKNNKDDNYSATSVQKSYTSQTLRISFKYPYDWAVMEGNDYPGSAQGNDYIKIYKDSEFIYTSAKKDCIENYTSCKPSMDEKISPNGWPFFSTNSTSQETKDILDTIISTVVILK